MLAPNNPQFPILLFHVWAFSKPFFPNWSGSRVSSRFRLEMGAPHSQATFVGLLPYWSLRMAHTGKQSDLEVLLRSKPIQLNEKDSIRMHL